MPRRKQEQMAQRDHPETQSTERQHQIPRPTLQNCDCRIALAFMSTTASLSTTQFPPEYSVVIQMQNEIGWTHLFTGRWAKAWSAIEFPTTIRDPLDDNPASITAWIRRYGRLLLTQWWELWKIRNDEQHNQTQETPIIRPAQHHHAGGSSQFFLCDSPSPYRCQL